MVQGRLRSVCIFSVVTFFFSKVAGRILSSAYVYLDAVLAREKHFISTFRHSVMFPASKYEELHATNFPSRAWWRIFVSFQSLVSPLKEMGMNISLILFSDFKLERTSTPQRVQLQWVNSYPPDPNSIPKTTFPVRRFRQQWSATEVSHCILSTVSRLPYTSASTSAVPDKKFWN
jgi:hypothetical protein